MYNSEGVMEDTSWSAELRQCAGVSADICLTLLNPTQRSHCCLGGQVDSLKNESQKSSVGLHKKLTLQLEGFLA